MGQYGYGDYWFILSFLGWGIKFFTVIWWKLVLSKEWVVIVKKMKKGGYRKKESKWFHKKMKEISAKGPTDRGATLLRKNYNPWNDWTRRHPWNDWTRRQVEKKVKKKKEKRLGREEIDENIFFSFSYNFSLHNDSSKSHSKGWDDTSLSKAIRRLLATIISSNWLEWLDAGLAAPSLCN